MINGKSIKHFLKFVLITDSGNIEELLNVSTDVRFTRLWIDKYNNDTLSSIIKVIPEDKLEIKIIDERGEIDINLPRAMGRTNYLRALFSMVPYQCI